VADAQEARKLDPRRWLALTVVLVAGFMDLLDVTIVNVAIPTVLRDLHQKCPLIWDDRAC
jgi:hypothetical protein